MARKSPEARGAAVWRAGSIPPAPPKHLAAAAAAMWRQIAGSRPADYFDPAAQGLLELYVDSLVTVRKLIKLRDAQNITIAQRIALDKQIDGNKKTAALLASKLRLSIQAAIRPQSGHVSERENEADPLLGGSAVRKRQA